MADPFADVDGIVQATETEVSITQSALFAKDKGPEVVKPEEEGEEAYLERFPRRVRSKASMDLKYRMEMEKAIHAAMVELHNVREQLYLVRFDDLRSTEEVKRDVQNYMSEIERLESKVTKLREKMLENFTKSLNLEQVGVSGAALITTSLHHKNSMVPQHKTQGSDNRLYSEGALAPRFGRVMSRHDLDGSTPPPSQSASQQEEGDLLRKYSFGLLGVKSPGAQNRAASPISDFFGMGNSGFDKRKLSPEEVAEVRATLYNLKQKKELTAQEEAMVETLTAKLRTVNDS